MNVVLNHGSSCCCKCSALKEPWDDSMLANCTVLLQAALDRLLPGQGEVDAADREGYGMRSFGDRVFGNPLGKGTAIETPPGLDSQSMQHAHIT